MGFPNSICVHCMPRLIALIVGILFVAVIAHAHHGPVSTAEWIAAQEGLRLEPYRDSAGVLTVCVGHTASVEQRAYTRAECLDLLAADLREFRGEVALAVEPDPLGNQETALVSLAFNIGESAFRWSKLVRLINAGAAEHAVTIEWLSWDHAHVDGRAQVVAGLLERRRREVALYYGE